MNGLQGMQTAYTNSDFTEKCVQTGPKQTALEEAISNVDALRQHITIILGDITGFLDRAGVNLTGAGEKNNPGAPVPSGQLPRLGTSIRETSALLNTLSERVNKLNQIA